MKSCLFTISRTDLNHCARWEGKGTEEKGIDTASGKVLVQIDPRYFRPAEVECVLFPFYPRIYIPLNCLSPFLGFCWEIRQRRSRSWDGSVRLGSRRCSERWLRLISRRRTTSLRIKTEHDGDF